MAKPGRRSPQSARDRIDARRAGRRRPRTWQDVVYQHPWPIGIALVLLAVLLVAAIGWVRASRAISTIQQEDPRLRQTQTRPRVDVSPQPGAATAVVPVDGLVPTRPPLPDTLRDPFNVLLIGVDRRPDMAEGVRSDTLIVVHVDPQAKWASMLSIPRDSLVTIPHIGQTKINAAYANGYNLATELYGDATEPEAGGAALAAETVEGFLGVPVDYTAQVDFNGFAALVDSVGGVVLDVPRPLLDAEYPTEDYGVERLYIPAGLQTLDGSIALKYARSRHLSNDFDRSQRQQAVLRALLNQVRERGVLANVSTLPEWAAVLEQNIRTTLPISDLSAVNGLAALAGQLTSDRITQFSVNPNDVAIDWQDGSNISWNQSDVAALVARWRAGPQPPALAAESARVQVLNGAAADGVAGQVSAFLTARGFTVAEPANAPRAYEHTTLIDYTGRPETRRQLAAVLGLNAAYVTAIAPADAPPANGSDIVLIVGQDYNPAWIGN